MPGATVRRTGATLGLAAFLLAGLPAAAWTEEPADRPPEASVDTPVEEAAETRAAARPTFALVEPQQLTGEWAFSIALLATNSRATELAFERSTRKILAGPLSGLLETEAGTFPVTLYAIDEDGWPRALAKGGFARRVYRVSLPREIGGVALLQLLDLDVTPVWFPIAPPAGADEGGGFPLTHPTTGPLKDAGEKSGSKRELIDRILSGLSTYEPVYFIAGGDFEPVTAKFQLSAQYRILLGPPGGSEASGFLGVAERFGRDLYAGYTQTSVWELSSPSAPFRDTSFRPGFYYWNSRFDERFGFARGPWSRLGMQVGFEHESNGQDDDDSRSMTYAFFRPIFTLGDERGWHWTVAPKAYAYLEKGDNEDIDDYRGYVDLLVKFGRLEGFEFTASLRKGVKKAYGSAQLDVSYPIALLARRMGAFLQLQYFYGYGDTLLGYDDNAHSQVRAGVMIVPYGAFYR
jgi:outer membrane phospholipase A